MEPEAARRAADALLVASGFDLAAYGEPELRRVDRGQRTDLTVRYPSREEIFGREVPYGVQVTFAGEQLTGFEPWIEDPAVSEFNEATQPAQLLEIVRLLSIYVLLLLVAGAFLRRYHAGEVGVRRAVQVFALILLASFLQVISLARIYGEGVSIGVLSQQQTTWFLGFWLLILSSGAAALLAALSWSVGEVSCRERMPHKLAAFDAVFQSRWHNGTVARSVFRGTAAGVGLAALLLLAAIFLGPAEGGLSLGALSRAPSAALPLVVVLAGALAQAFVFEMVGRLLFVPAAVARLGRWVGGAVAAVVAAILFEVPVTASPIGLFFGLSLIFTAFLVAVFLRYDLLTVLLASGVAHVVLGGAPLLATGLPGLQLQGGLALVVAALPLLLTVKDLTSREELTYRWEDVPPHVRRIAERERQRVELETARGIQSSILPELPPQLHGVEIAHTYLPATEVGGDFYDVLALEDGRLALAVGDVAGHGVSSGLVMSMAKSALAVQVTFDPEVDAVFRTLNRTVYQTARRRLLTTLCYALLDPKRRELLYASAGHLFPYVIEPEGRVEALESVAYPLGVRGEIEVHSHLARLPAGCSLFFFSDGVVEARRDGTDELFGFERLEASLKRHAGAPPRGLLEGVLDDVARFTGPGPREDDQTILVLRLPAA
jgi:hypothetical protein